MGNGIKLPRQTCFSSVPFRGTFDTHPPRTEHGRFSW